MQVTLDDIKRYTFCPKYYEQQGPIYNGDESNELFRKFLTIVFRRDLETGVKSGWKYVRRRWAQVFYKQFESNEINDKLFLKSIPKIHLFHKWYLETSCSVVGLNHMLSASLYENQIIGSIPVILAEDNKFTLILNEPAEHAILVLLNPAVRYMGLALSEEFPDFTIDKVHNVSFENFEHFDHTNFSPGPSYWDSAMIDFTSIISSMKLPLTYPNVMSCGKCPLVFDCSAYKY